MRHKFAIVYIQLNDVTTLVPEYIVNVSEGKRTQGRHTGGILYHIYSSNTALT